jgi:antitoxin CcdA
VSDSKIDTSHPIEDKSARASKIERERFWLVENAEAIAEANAYIEKHGLPFAKYRQF